MHTEYDALAEIYDRWASGDPAAGPSHDFYVDLCRSCPGRVVELGIGTGRIALDVVCADRPVLGVDGSAAMLEVCRRRAGELGLQEYLTLLHADLQTFDLGWRADLIVLPFRSIGHLLTWPDRRLLLDRVRRHLAPGGRFVFDHYIFSESWAQAHDGVPRLLYASPVGEAPGILVWDTYRYDFAARTMRCLITVETTDAEGQMASRRHAPLSFSWFEVPAMRDALTETGLVVEALYGGFDRRPFDEQATDQVWVVSCPG
jgi:SAM-dependent methyltransferase